MDDLIPLDVFHFEDDKPNFENFGSNNSFLFWYARDFMHFLGYESYESFRKAINKAITSCMTLNIVVTENFLQERRLYKGKYLDDYRLSKFACYLVAMNGDPKKPEVAKAQAYFATITEAFQRYIREVEDVERVYIRDEVSEHEKSLSSAAKKAGIMCYVFFQNKGYLGLYNMSLSDLKKWKNIPDNRTPLDFMGKEELAANLFRITQTEAKIRNENIKGQAPLEDAAYKVGKKVRKTMEEISNTFPEDLPIATDINKVKSDLKKTHRELRKKENRKEINENPGDN